MPENQKTATTQDTLLIGFAAGVAVTAFACIPLVRSVSRRSFEAGQSQFATAILGQMLRIPR